MPPMAGRMISENPLAREIFVAGIGTEIVYSFLIIVCSLMIYFGTKELYELSSHKGIKYFRQAFLFFAVAYFFRSFIKFILLYFNTEEILEFSGLIGAFTAFVFIYFSFMAIFYLLYSFIWKKWGDDSGKIYLLHAAAFIISVITILFRTAQIYLLMNFLVFIFVVLLAVSAYKSSGKKESNLYIIYILLSVFWLLNVFDIVVPDFLQAFQILIYLASSGIFLAILYKVIKRTGDN